MSPRVKLCLAIAVLSCAPVAPAHADEITDWNRHMLEVARMAATGPVPLSRIAACVQAAVFDAVNGIERRYTPIQVQPNAAPGASRRAAAVQAAYATLLKLYVPDTPSLTELQTAIAAFLNQQRA